jgi:hypothetical protein
MVKATGPGRFPSHGRATIALLERDRRLCPLRYSSARVQGVAMFRKLLLALFGAVALGAFVFLVKLMHDMTVQMTVMTGQVTRMADQMTVMNANIQAMGQDVRGMREGMDRMAGVVQRGSQQIEQLNPMEMMRGVVPGQQSR